MELLWGFFSNRRDNILEDEIEKVLIFGQGENINTNFFFGAAKRYAVEHGADIPKYDEDKSVSFKMVLHEQKIWVHFFKVGLMTSMMAENYEDVFMENGSAEEQYKFMMKNSRDKINRITNEFKEDLKKFSGKESYDIDPEIEDIINGK